MTTDLKTLDAWWRAANYLAVGQIYLMDNPLLREPLAPEHIKPRLLGHWGTTPGLTFLWAHLNRVITRDALRALYITGPGHGGPAVVATAWMEGTYSELYSQVPQDADGMKELFRQFSFPGGIPSHAAPETPGSIHEGGELGYSLAHAYGAAFDNPDLLVACVIGDGEAETGPLAGSWQANKFLHPVHDGTVLPVLHLNGYKIANSTVLSRITRDELLQQLSGHGHRPFVVEGGFDGEDPMAVHERMAATLDEIVAEIARIREHAARQLAAGEPVDRPRWPALVLCTPKGWTGPREVDGVPVEGTWRAHQVPLAETRENPEHRAQLEAWMRSYRPEELFDEHGTPLPELTTCVPEGDARMSASPHANGGQLLRDLRLPDFTRYGIDVAEPGGATAAATATLGTWLADVIRENPRYLPHRRTGRDRLEPPAGRVRGHRPAVPGRHRAGDEHVAQSGRVVEVLSNTCPRLVGGPPHRPPRPVQLLRGVHPHRRRHVQPACQVARDQPPHPVAGSRWPRSTTCSPARVAAGPQRVRHQDPGLLEHGPEQEAQMMQAYLPPDAKPCWLRCDHCLRAATPSTWSSRARSRGPQWLVDGRRDRALHGDGHLGLGELGRGGAEPDVVHGLVRATWRR